MTVLDPRARIPFREMSRYPKRANGSLKPSDSDGSTDHGSFETKGF